MKKSIKLLAIILLGMSTCSCQKDFEIPVALQYAYEPLQPIVINIDVVPLEDVVVDFEGLVKEVNADYFNRYGIAINATLKSREFLTTREKEEGGIFLPQQRKVDGKFDKIVVYIIPEEFLYWEAAAYSVIQGGSIILREDYQVNRTLAHELGHTFGLDHVKLPNNVMTPYKIAKQVDEPNVFVEQQVDTIVGYLNSNFKF